MTAGQQGRQVVGRSLGALGDGVALAWRGARWRLVAVVLLELTIVAGGIAQLFAVRHVLGLLERGATTTGALVGLGLLLGITAGLGSLVGPLRLQLGETISVRLVEHIAAAVGRAPLREFDDPDFHDAVHLATREAAHRPLDVVIGLLSLTTGLVGLAGSLAVIVLFVPVLAVLAALGLLPLFVVARRDAAEYHRFVTEFTRLDRESGYLRRLLTGREHAAELRVHQMIGPLRERLADVGRTRLVAMRAVTRRRARRALVASLLTSVAAVVGFQLVVDALERGALGLTEAVTVAAALLQLRGRLSIVQEGVGRLSESAKFLDSIARFLARNEHRAADLPPLLAIAPAATAPAADPPAPVTPAPHNTAPATPAPHNTAPATLAPHNTAPATLAPHDEPPVTPASHHTAPNTTSPHAPAVAQGLRFEQVCFRYPAASAMALVDIDLTVAPGEIVALVGENGSGKSTLAKLACGLYRPDRGRVRWDEDEVAELPGSDSQRRVAAVLQDFGRYAFTVRDNVAAGDWSRPPHPLDTVDALGAAGAGFVAGLPGGVDTRLGREFDDAVDLSVGQWQRIALARAFYRDAPLVVLDEPTAALDPKIEADLFASLRTLCRGRTVLLITHRLTNLPDVDRIVVLHEGRIVEQGTPKALAAAGGRFAGLVALQRSRRTLTS